MFIYNIAGSTFSRQENSNQKKIETVLSNRKTTINLRAQTMIFETVIIAALSVCKK